MTPLSLTLSFAAGGLSTLSPCVFSLMPVLAGSALQEDRRGPLAFGAGLALTYSMMGVIFAAGGAILGLTDSAMRTLGGAFLITAGMVLLFPALRTLVSSLLSRFTGGFAQEVHRRPSQGLGGQFLLGALIGAVWLPCTGPTLGAALALAGTGGGGIFNAWVSMLVYSLGALLPFLLIAYGLRAWMLKRKSRAQHLARLSTSLMGILITALGAATLTGADKRAEAWILERMPEWLLNLTTWL